MLYEIIVRLHRQDSAFFYFQLEANEGLCFYSTLPQESPHETYRDIRLCGDRALKGNILHLIEVCQERFPIEIRADKLL